MELGQEMCFALDPDQVIPPRAKDELPVAVLRRLRQHRVPELAVAQEHHWGVSRGRAGRTGEHLQVRDSGEVPFLPPADSPGQGQGPPLIAARGHQHLAMSPGGAAVQDQRQHVPPMGLEKRPDGRRVVVLHHYRVVLHKATLPLQSCGLDCAQRHFARHQRLLDTDSPGAHQAREHQA